MPFSTILCLAPKLAAGFLLALDALGGLTAAIVPVPEPPAPGAPAPPPVVHSEYYLLAKPLPARFSREQQQQSMVAAVALRKVETGGGTLYERDVTFREGGLRIRHTETIHGDARCLVWRELLPTSSRIWMAEWSTSAGYARTTAYGWNRPVHEALAPAPSGRRDLLGPLELLDGVRRGDIAARASVAVVDPRAAVAIDATVAVDIALGGKAMESDRLTVRRADESIVLDAVPRHLDGSDLPSLNGTRWTAGAARLRPVDRAEYERHRRRWAVAARRPYDAMLERIPTRR